MEIPTTTVYPEYADADEAGGKDHFSRKQIKRRHVLSDDLAGQY